MTTKKPIVTASMRIMPDIGACFTGGLNRQLAGRRVDGKLRELWKAINNAQIHFVTHLHLNHFGGQAGSNPLSVFHLELHLAPTPLNQVIQQQGGQMFQIFFAGVLAKIENLRHWPVLTVKIGQASLSPNRSRFHNAPKGGGLSKGTVSCPYNSVTSTS